MAALLIFRPRYRPKEFTKVLKEGMLQGFPPAFRPYCLKLLGCHQRSTKMIKSVEVLLGMVHVSFLQMLSPSLQLNQKLSRVHEDLLP